jgi:hypothetical protein
MIPPYGIWSSKIGPASNKNPRKRKRTKIRELIRKFTVRSEIHDER